MEPSALLTQHTPGAAPGARAIHGPWAKSSRTRNWSLQPTAGTESLNNPVNKDSSGAIGQTPWNKIKVITEKILGLREGPHGTPRVKIIQLPSLTIT